MFSSAFFLVVGAAAPFPGEKVVDGDAQRSAQGEHQADLGQSFAAFPFGYGLVADAKFVCQLPLGQVPGFSGRGNESADLNLIHGGPPFRASFYVREGKTYTHGA